MKPRGVGQSGRIPNSFTTTRSAKAGTLRPGNSRNSSQKRFVQASDHCATRRTERISRTTKAKLVRLRRLVMPTKSGPPTRRDFFAVSTAAGVASAFPALLVPAGDASGQTSKGVSQMTTEAAGIRPFSLDFPEDALLDLRRRINATRWPGRETVDDDSQGVRLATMQNLAAYWGKEYDWRKCEAKLKGLPHFVTEIDGLDIHFIHVRSKHENALPLIVTHGWPGSVIEQLKIVEPLTDPTAHGGTEADAFHLVIPSIPGYGFSGKPATTGWDAVHIARAWAMLMERLGYTRYVAQGGDWGAIITDQMGVQQPAGLI